MALKLKFRTMFPALVQVLSPLTLLKEGLLYRFGFDIAALRTSLDPFYPAVSNVREKLTANRTYYVSATGSDDNSGLANGTPFRTPTKAMSVIANTLDLAGFTVTIQFADGTYADQPFIAQSYVGPGNIALVGNLTTPANVSFTTSVVRNAIFSFDNLLGNWTINGFKLSSSLGSGNGNGIYVSRANLVFGNMDFGALAGGLHITAIYNAHIEKNAAYTISGGAAYHLYSGDSSILHTTAAGTITITGTPAFSGAFLAAHGAGAVIGVDESQYSGTATGNSFEASVLGLIDVASPNLLPGNGLGSISGGGVVAGVSANPTFGGASVGYAGGAVFGNATSGSIAVIAPTGALGSRTLTLPKETGTLLSTAFSSPITNSVTVAVPMTTQNTYYDGPSVGQGSTGTWVAFGSVRVNSPGANQYITAKLWDGTTLIASAGGLADASTFAISISLSGVIASPAGNIRISCSNTAANGGTIGITNGVDAKASTISASRIA